jgi:hypothetical protein
MTQARDFVALLNRAGTLFDVEIGIQALTDPNAVSSDENLAERQYQSVTVSFRDLELHGASKFLFIETMLALARTGNPETLRIEWAPDHFSIDHEAAAVSAHLMVIGHSEFATHDPIDDVTGIAPALQATGISLLGESQIEVPGLPEPKPHAFTTPSLAASTRALATSLLLAAYDAGGPDVELTWRQAPKTEYSATRKLWTASATALIAPKQRIVVAA